MCTRTEDTLSAHRHTGTGRCGWLPISRVWESVGKIANYLCVCAPMCVCVCVCVTKWSVRAVARARSSWRLKIGRRTSPLCSLAARMGKCARERTNYIVAGFCKQTAMATYRHSHPTVQVVALHQTRTRPKSESIGRKRPRGVRVTGECEIQCQC